MMAYDCKDLNFVQNFHSNDRGQTHFTISPKVRQEILHRLLELNLKIAKKEIKNFEVGVLKYGRKRN